MNLVFTGTNHKLVRKEGKAGGFPVWLKMTGPLFFTSRVENCEVGWSTARVLRSAHGAD